MESAEQNIIGLEIIEFDCIKFHRLALDNDLTAAGCRD